MTKKHIGKEEKAFMEKQKVTYFQFQKELDYQVYLRLEGDKLESALTPSLISLGFSEVEEEELKKTAFHKHETKVLKINEAGVRVAKQIQSFAGPLAAYGPESLSNQGTYQVYRYQNVGIMVFSEASASWEMGLVRPEHHETEIKTMLVRYVSWALGGQGVVGFWAVPVDEGFVIMRPVEAQFEVVFVDVKKMRLITQSGVKSIGADLNVMRLDETLHNETRGMSRESLLSYMGANTCYFSQMGITPAMRHGLYELTSFARGVIYPTENFRPRKDLGA